MTALDVFNDHDRILETGEVESAARATFGLVAKAAALGGERDQNFRLDVEGQDPVLLKISHSAEDPDVTDLQTQILKHLEATDPALSAPRLLGGPAGWDFGEARPRTLRLTSFLPGKTLEELETTPETLAAVGAALARMDLALTDFRHPAEDAELLWDVQNVLRLRFLEPEVADPQLRDLARRGLDRFEAEAGALPGLRRQMIHNDLNTGNVMLNAPGVVSGIFDFGDALRAPLIQELAVCAAYHVRVEGDPLADVAVLTQAYEAVLPISPEEKALLPTLIVARLAMSILIASWRARLHPDNAEYILRNLGKAIGGLGRLLGDAREARLA